MRILGIDPGSIVMGFGIIDKQQNKYNYVTSGCIKLGQKDWPLRLKYIYQDISSLITTYQPQQVAIEQAFVHKNPMGALKLGQARGAAIAACACHDLLVAEYAARKIKQTVVGYGNAEKSQVQAMVKLLLQLEKPPPPDAADALAAAICHINRGNLRHA